MMQERRTKTGHCVSPHQKAKSHIIAQLVRIACRERLDYDDFLYVCQQARKKLGLHKLQQARKLPHLLSEAELHRFFQVIQQCGNLQHEIMLKLLFYTAVRVRELVSIRVNDVDLNACKIFIQQGKGNKDRYILFPQSFRLALKSYLYAHLQHQSLFETQRRGPFTTRRVQQIVQHYRRQAGIMTPVHLHLFRHQMLTYLTKQGLSDAQLQLISGHESKKSLEIYQHLSLDTVQHAYQDAVRAISIESG